MSITACANSIGTICRVIAILFVLATALNLAGKQTAASNAAQLEQPPYRAGSGPGRFAAKFDGGPIETQKLALRLGIAFHIPGSGYLGESVRYPRGQMIDLLVQAKINFVWVTYSAGFSAGRNSAARRRPR
jgi:hypothetical protein